VGGLFDRDVSGGDDCATLFELRSARGPGVQMTAAEKSKKYMNLLQASDYCQIPVKTLRNKIRLGLLPAYKPGKCILIDPKELDIFIRKARKKFAS
jgi:hypothetical protein